MQRREKLRKEVHLGEIERIFKSQFGQAMRESYIMRDELVIRLEPERLLEFCNFAKNEEKLSFDFLRCLSGVDYPDHLEVVYHLYSIKYDSKITLKVSLSKDKPVVSSVTSVWQGANWHEREVAELFGITFEGHPDPRKLLLPEDFKEYPLRKDFKLNYEKEETFN